MRPLSVGMGNAIRYLKYEISILPADWSDEQSKSHLMDRVDAFVLERMERADAEIIDCALEKIQDGDVVLTYGKSFVVQSLLLRAQEDGKRFSVVVVDTRPMLEGKHLLTVLVKAGIACTYTTTHGLGVAMKDVTKVFLGAHAVLGNGAILARVGTASVCMSAYMRRVPVLVCCQTYKFTDKVQMDSFVYNEIGKGDALVSVKGKADVLAGWKEHQDRLKLLNLQFDVTPPEMISAVVTDIGPIPNTSVPVVLREYRPIQFQMPS